MWAETQFPPAMDIGCGCCGVQCVGGAAAEARELPEDYAPMQESM